MNQKERDQVAAIQEYPDIILAMLRLLKEHGYTVVIEEAEPLRLIKGGKD